MTNASWVAVDVYHDVWAQAFLQAVYFALALWGLWAWRKDLEDKLAELIRQGAVVRLPAVVVPRSCSV